MKLIIIFGPQAVGKMTVGQELEKITDLKLFHNHMTIDLVSPYFSYSTSEGKRLVGLFREEIFRAVAQSELPGLIFTFVWAFDVEQDHAYIRHLTDMFVSQGAEVCYVELEANVAERLERNKSSNRLLHKPTKRDIAWSEGELLHSMRKYRLNSEPGEVKHEHYLRIDNTNQSAEQSAQRIRQHFNL
ncbi:AAA domain-containing protein [Paenibacillus polysaccharolyticus]|uniref:AAA domain-containing protein n=1 Tax=Paenibacillus polysaccharolyticus TaxID=582692 RepID=A0A1G5E7A1_9BACL|nr:AAA family ATPase [Paenibacillus polysaccharolyticus]SCY22904.1 AAA domain-containing protein [Paenibacillus polysaccharolyticus]